MAVDIAGTLTPVNIRRKFLPFSPALALWMKRMRSSDDLDSNSNSNRSSSSHRAFYFKSENVRKGLLSSSSSSRYDRDRSAEEDRESSRSVRKRLDHDSEGFDRRKGFERSRDLVSSPRSGYGGDRDRIHRSESFGGARREFPKGFRSERDRSRREGSVSSWRRFGSKEFEEGRGSRESGSEQSRIRSPRGVREGKSPTWSKESGSEQSKIKSPTGLKGGKSPTWSKDSGSERSKSVEVKKAEELQAESGSSSEMEEGELEPEPEALPCGGLDSDHKENESEDPVEDANANVEVEGKAVSENVAEVKNEIASEGKTEAGSPSSHETEKDAGKEVDEMSDCEKVSNDRMSGSGDAIEDGVGENNGGNKEEECSRENSSGKEEEAGKEEFVEKILPLEEDQKERKARKDIDLEVAVRDIDLTEPSKEAAGENGVPEVNLTLLSAGFKDKGKSVAVSPSDVDDSAGESSPVKKSERSDQSGANKHKDEKLSLEPLDLSLSLPDVLLPIASHDAIPAAPGSPSYTRSVQSLSNTFLTNSDGFTASMSFSGSQHFVHNPSCSLTHNSLDNYEQSVGSRPIFQGIDQISHGAWQGQTSNEPKHKEVPLYSRMLMNGNGSLHHSQAAEGVRNGNSRQGQHLKAEGSSKLPIGLDRQLSFQKQLSGVQPWHHNDVRSPSQSIGSRETGKEYSKDKEVLREKNGGSLYRSGSFKDQEQLPIGGADFVETIIARIVSEPMHLSAIQKALGNRSDITLEMLSKSHRAHLEILVALKTGLEDFLQQNSSIPSSELGEIFLNLRCRNLNCRSPLPVDEFGLGVMFVFIGAMLIVAYENHSLEMAVVKLGLKEVFQNFARDWSAETLSRELEYVKRIFRPSEDVRGRKLHDIADQMLARLAFNSQIHLPEIYNYIMSFLTESDSAKFVHTPLSGKELPASNFPGKEIPNKNQVQAHNGTAGTSQEATWRNSAYSEKSPQVAEKCSKDPVFDELESIVRIKQAEAKMFQSRADDARREAEGLRRIAVAKNEKIEEEYTSRIAKLRLVETEEMRKQKLEELHSLERAHREYYNMKMRMEEDIKDLLLKMEATKRNLAI
ncbi:Protein OBERON 4 [Vitis vinifera]|uniref:Protein OBERON 4 n=1 Tax=Vitis vinifera TaxID=29760 RepID=A0A438CBZ5_VITVI|nr:Protein OBERON 4 [Vitis vinifera]